MGSYASLMINGYECLPMKSYVAPSAMSLFTEKDKIIVPKEDAEEYHDGYRHNITYKTTVKIAKTRLNIMGFNLKTSESIFQSSKNKKLADFDPDIALPNEAEQAKKNFIKFLDGFSFEKYLVSLKKIYDNNIYIWDENNYEERKESLNDPCIDFIVENFIYSQPHDDFRYYLRGFLEKLDDGIEIQIDLTQVVDAGYYNLDDNIAENSLGKASKTIIFTEGKYDTEIIQQCMQLLYPEYVDYFSFLDIEASNLELNSSRLITYLKSFISAGIINKVIVLFDNDTEGNYCKNELLKINKIPNNFSIHTYPNIDIAKNYPTIGPKGIENMDINERACSIELYLCKEALTKVRKLIPVQWSSFNEKMQRYQGSFSSKDKGEIQSKFNQILSTCKKSKPEIKKYDFFAMKILLQNIFSAFDMTLF